MTTLESVDQSSAIEPSTTSYDLTQKLETPSEVIIIEPLEFNIKEEEPGVLAFVSIMATSFVSVIVLVLCCFEIFD